jgi:5-methylcytosine-specific restriction endonuclease McrA
MLTHPETQSSARRDALGGRSLVLNASYEPISVVSRRRGVVLILANKAVAVVSSELAVHAESLCMPIPEVLRLRHFVNVPHFRRAPLSARAVLIRDNHECQYCASRADGIDHVHPRSRNGAHAWENVVAACRSCNSNKGDRLLTDTGYRLKRRPVAPPAMSLVALGGPVVPSCWHEYLLPMSATG